MRAPCVSSSCVARAGSSSGLFAATSTRPAAAALAWRARSCASHACAVRRRSSHAAITSEPVKPHERHPLLCICSPALDAHNGFSARTYSHKTCLEVHVLPLQALEASRPSRHGAEGPCRTARQCSSSQTVGKRLREVAGERGRKRKHDGGGQQERAEARGRGRCQRIPPPALATLRRGPQRRPRDGAPRHAHVRLERHLQRHHLRTA